MSDDNPHRTIRPVELLVAIVCICIAVGLLLPAIQRGEPVSGRTQCRNNLKHIALALQKYHDTYRMFPMGAMHAGSRNAPEIGPSWWYGILPYIDQPTLFDKIAHTQSEIFFQPHVEFTYASMPSGGSGRVQSMIRTLIAPTMRCPSSPLPEREDGDGPITMPSYVGIAGGCDIDPESTDHVSWPDGAGSPPTYRNLAKGRGPNQAIVTSSGLLPVAEHVSIADCTDGMSNVMIVGEQSDWLQDVDPAVSSLYHGDPGWNRDTARNPGGWLTGTNVVDPVPSVDPSGSAEPGEWSVDLLFNVTTVRYGPNRKRVISRVAADSLPGCAEVMGHNNPLQSPHAGGLQVAMCDGSCQFVASAIELRVLLQLAIRDDGESFELD